MEFLGVSSHPAREALKSSEIATLLKARARLALSERSHEQ